MKLKLDNRYDPVCDMVRKMEHASAAMVIIVDSPKGSGFSIKYKDRKQLDPALPVLLRRLAAEIDVELAQRERKAS